MNGGIELAGSIRRALVLALAAALALGAGCNKPRQVGPVSGGQAESPGTAAAGAGTAATVPTTAPAPAGAGATTAAPADVVLEEAYGEDLAFDWSEGVGQPAAEPEVKSESELLEERLRKLKFKARRDVVWLRDTIANIPSYERALKKYAQEFEQWGMYRRIPTTPDVEGLKKQVAAAVAAGGGEVLYLETQDMPIPARELPPTITGDRPFDFEDNDLRGIVQVILTIKKLDVAPRRKLLDGLKQTERLLMLRKVTGRLDNTLINLEAYYFKEISFPVHVIEPKDLETEMRQSGIELALAEVVKRDSIGHAQNAALSYKEFNASLAQVNAAMKLLSESKFKAARSEFFRRRSEEAARADPLPK
jgi:hypothetical protein